MPDSLTPLSTAHVMAGSFAEHVLDHFEAFVIPCSQCPTWFPMGKGLSSHDGGFVSFP